MVASPQDSHHLSIRIQGSCQLWLRGLRRHLGNMEVLRGLAHQIPLFSFRQVMLKVPLPPHFLCSRCKMSQVWTQLVKTGHREGWGTFYCLFVSSKTNDKAHTFSKNILGIYGATGPGKETLDEGPKGDGLKFDPGLLCLKLLVVWPRAARFTPLRVSLACCAVPEGTFKPCKLSLVNHFIQAGAHRSGIVICPQLNLEGSPNCRNEMFSHPKQ